jgi:hypothetical protein
MTFLFGTRKVIEAVYPAALDDEHKNQAAAMKLLMDRMLPISVCDKNADIRERRPNEQLYRCYLMMAILCTH